MHIPGARQTPRTGPRTDAQPPPLTPACPVPPPTPCSILRRKEAERAEKERKKAEKEAARLAAEAEQQRLREEEEARKVCVLLSVCFVSAPFAGV